MNPSVLSLRVLVLVAALIVCAPVVWILGGCLQGTTAGAGMAEVMTETEAQAADGVTLSVKDDPFEGTRIVRLRRNALPNPSGSVLEQLHFDGVCIGDACAAVVHSGQVAPLAEEFRRMHLIVDGVVIKDMRGRATMTFEGYALEGTLVVPLKVEALRAIIAAKEIAFRLEPKRAGDDAADLDGDGGMLEGTLSPQNVLNLRELLTQAGVDPWAAKVEDPNAPRTAPTVGSPPGTQPRRTAPVVGSPPPE